MTRAKDNEIKELREKTAVALTVGGGLAVYGTMEAVKRVQNYILLDSAHPIEKEDVRKSLMRELQARDAEIARYKEALQEAEGFLREEMGMDDEDLAKHHPKLWAALGIADTKEK